MFLKIRFIAKFRIISQVLNANLCIPKQKKLYFSGNFQVIEKLLEYFPAAALEIKTFKYFLRSSKVENKSQIMNK